MRHKNSNMQSVEV